MGAQKAGEVFQSFKAKLSHKLLLENIPGSETPEADSSRQSQAVA